MLTPENLIQDLIQAFPLYPIPQNPAVVSHGSEPLAVEAYFTNKKWTDVTLADIKANYSEPMDTCLFYMTDEAYVYFLPAFIIMEITDPVGTDAAGDHMIGSLVLPSWRKIRYLEDDDQFIAKFKLYNEKQKSLIATFLKYKSHTKAAALEAFRALYPNNGDLDNTAQVALDSYWGQFLPKVGP